MVPPPARPSRPPGPTLAASTAYCIIAQCSAMCPLGKAALTVPAAPCRSCCLHNCAGLQGIQGAADPRRPGGQAWGSSSGSRSATADTRGCNDWASKLQNQGAIMRSLPQSGQGDDLSLCDTTLRTLLLLL